MIEILEDLGELIFGNKRQGALKHFARRKGFQYMRRVNPSLLPMEVQRMGFFEGSRSRSLKGLLTKTESELNIKSTIFDYLHYHEFGNKTTTVYLYEYDKLGLPIFTIAPRSTLAKLGSMFSSSEWAAVDKNFDKNFTVTSTDMNAMRMMVTIQFAELMSELEGFVVEGNDQYLVMYKTHSMTDIIDMDNHHDAALELIDIILHDASGELV